MYPRIRTVAAPQQPPSRRRGVSGKQKLTAASCLATAVLTWLTAVPASRGQTLTTLHSFASGGGGIPTADLLLGSDGNLYGATSGYSVTRTVGTLNPVTFTTQNSGSIFRLSTTGTGFTTLRAFSVASNGISLDGISPRGGLVEGANPGVLYGTTSGITEAITYDEFGDAGTVTTTATGSGTVFRLDTTTSTPTFTTIYSFAGSTSGAFPAASLILGNGPLYGTTSGGATIITGTTAGTSEIATTQGVSAVFSITNTGLVTSLGEFIGGAGGGSAIGGLTEGKDGNYYGTTYSGGSITIDGTTISNEGTVFQITPAGTITTIYTFTGGDDGGNPTGKLARPGDGYLYGTTTTGAGGYGTIYRVTSSGTFETLYTFSGTPGGDSGVPIGGLIAGTTSDGNFNGNLYGTTAGFSSLGVDGNLNFDYGSIFQFTPSETSPTGTLITLYNFTGGTDGGFPQGGLVQDSQNNLYGTTSLFGGQGSNGLGTVFTLTNLPPPYIRPAFFNGEFELNNGVYYLTFANSDFFGYYSFLADPAYIYHFDLGYEYVIDANDGKDGVYLYDFASNDFFYTSPTFPFPYLYDFDLNSVLYYFPDTTNPDHYTSNPRYFYDYATSTVITK